MRKSVGAIALCCILAAGSAAAAPPQSAQAEASFAPSSLALRTPVTGWTAARLVVAGPEGFRVERRFLAGEPVAVDFSRLKDANGDRVEVPDGRFKWELTLTAPIPGSTPQPESNDVPLQVWVSSGSYSVEGGSFVAPPPDAREVPTATGEANGPIGPVVALTTNPYGNSFSGSLYATGGVGSGCTDGDTDLYFGELLVKDSAPWVTMRDTNDDQLWRWWSSAGDLKLNTGRLNGSNWLNPFTIEKDGPENTLYLDNTGAIGINTSAPSVELSIVDGSDPNGIPEIVMTSPSDGDATKILEGIYWFSIGSSLAGGAFSEPLRIYNGAPSYVIDIKPTGDLVLGGAFTNYAPVTIGYNTTATNSLVAPMIVTTYSTGTPANGFGAMTQWGLEAADGTLAVAADFGGLWENASAKDGYLIFRAAHNGAATEYLRIEGSTGYVGFQSANPAYPIHHGNGARLTTGGVWTDASSRAFKQDIETLDADAAMAAFKELTPVTYAYKADPTEHHAGFIAEDVPDLVASGDRTGLAPMDVVAVLTKVVQEQQRNMDIQQKTIESQQAQIAELRRIVGKLAPTP